MASKSFYACDGCGSFIDRKVMHVVRILVGPDSGFNPFEPAHSTPTDSEGQPMTVHRQICRTCAEDLIGKFKLLARDPDELTRLAFGEGATPKVGIPDAEEDVRRFIDRN